MMIKWGLPILILLFFSCNNNVTLVPSDQPTCGMTYQTSDIYFNQEDTIVMKVKFHFIVDDSTEVVDSGAIDEFLRINNAFYSHAQIQFISVGFCVEYNPEESHNMPNFKKFGAKHSEPNCLNVFVYSNEQPYYTGDTKFTVGVASGIGGTFFAVRENFLRTLTATHEIGHMFGLMHIDVYDETDGKSIFTGDLVCDTPAASSLGTKINYLCQYVGLDKLSDEDKEILSRNLMSWVHLHCREFVTHNQIARMRWTIHNSLDLRNAIYELRNEL